MMLTRGWLALLTLALLTPVLTACSDDGDRTRLTDAGLDQTADAADAALDGPSTDVDGGLSLTDGGGLDPSAARIQPYAKNPWYWQYQGQPVLLLGASDEDNLFQLEELEQQLDELVRAGGNYVRNTMSSRDEGNLHPFAKDGDGRYDLARWNEAYWDRFEHFLSLTHARGVIVQIEVWDRFDHSRASWVTNPYNPENNINYTELESGLATRYPEHPSNNLQPFFHTPPSMDDNVIVRQYQEAFVDRMLSHSFAYDHVLYVIDNETDEAPEWPAYWAQYILAAAADASVEVELTEMWDDRNITSSSQHQYTWDHRELFSFTDISQNNHQTGETHWNQILFVRDRLSSDPMPMNSVKIYGADTGSYGTTADAVERFWRNILGGMASSRFHRPTAGIGLSPLAAAQLTAARLVADQLTLLELEPAQDLLGERSTNEAYAAAAPGGAYLVYFTARGSVTLDLAGQPGAFEVSWIELADAGLKATEAVEGGGQVTLAPPAAGGWIAAVVPR